MDSAAACSAYLNRIVISPFHIACNTASERSTADSVIVTSMITGRASRIRTVQYFGCTFEIGYNAASIVRSFINSGAISSKNISRICTYSVISVALIMTIHKIMTRKYM